MEEKNEEKASFTVGTPAKGGSFKIYFDPGRSEDDLKAAEAKLENGLKILTWLRGQGYPVGVQ